MRESRLIARVLLWACAASAGPALMAQDPAPPAAPAAKPERQDAAKPNDEVKTKGDAKSSDEIKSTEVERNGASTITLIEVKVRPDAKAKEDAKPKDGAKAAEDATLKEGATPKDNANAAKQHESARQKTAEAARAARAVAAKVVNQNAMRLADMHRPYLKTELNFIRQTCDLAPEQRRQVKAAGEASLTAAADKDDVRGLIRRDLQQSLEKALPAEQFARYRDAQARRDARQKEAILLFIVAGLDEKLRLSAEQRAAVRETLSGQWRDSWQSWQILTRFGDSYFPSIPADCVAKFRLDAAQQEIWGRANKIDPSSVHFGVQRDAEDAEDEKWWNGGETSGESTPPAAAGK